MKGKTNISNKIHKQKLEMNYANIIHSNTQNNNIEKNVSFPIWEKIYLEKKENIEYEYIDEEYLSCFFKSSKSINIKNYLYIFPSTKSDNKYAIIDLNKNYLYFHKMPYQCFNPIYSKKFYFSIFLFFIDQSYKSDRRFNIVEFDIKNNTFNILNSKGVAPKERNNFSSFFYLNKIYFFGGLPKIMVDNSLNYIYSFNIKENEWKIEESNYMDNKENINNTFIGNNFDTSIIQVEDKNIFYSFGGKCFNDLMNPEINIMGIGQNEKFKEIYDIIKIIIKDNGTIELSNIKNNNEYKLENPCSIFDKENIYIYNKDELFTFNHKNQELCLLQKKMFSPEIEGYGNIFIYERFLYLFGKFKYYDDCFLFKINLDKMKETLKINYENLFNNINKNKDNKDILCEFNNPEEKKLYLNKILLSNFSSNLRNILYNNKAQNHINFININYPAFLIIIKWIYNLFEDNINNLSKDIYKHIFNIFFKYKARSLMNIFISKIIINEHNALFLYVLGNKYDLKDLVTKTHKYICKSLISKKCDKILSENNETKEFKQKLYENYFCEHKLYIECMINNLDIHNSTDSTINNEQLNNIKKLNKNGKLFYCLTCYKVFIPNEEDKI